MIETYVYDSVYAKIEHMIQGRKLQDGFTIIESLIVLAASGLIFLIAVAAISGKQAKTEFQTGINNTQQQIQQIINQTISGYFPHSTSYSCNGASATTMGSNYGCVFLGKVLLFGVQGGSGVTVYSLTGDQAATDIASSHIAVLPSDTVVRDTLPNSLSVVSMTYDGVPTGPRQQTAGVAFLAGDSSGNITNSSVGGAQQFSLYAVSGTQASTTQESDMVYDLGRGRATYKLVHAKQVQICIASGGTNQSGLITIGSNTTGSTGGLTVNLQIYGGKVCT